MNVKPTSDPPAGRVDKRNRNPFVSTLRIAAVAVNGSTAVITGLGTWTNGVPKSIRYESGSVGFGWLTVKPDP
jgi:hypothetical protein